MSLLQDAILLFSVFSSGPVRRFNLAHPVTNGRSHSAHARRGELNWRAKVQLFEEIRWECKLRVGAIAGAAKKLDVGRRMVREAIRSVC